MSGKRMFVVTERCIYWDRENEAATHISTGASSPYSFAEQTFRLSQRGEFFSYRFLRFPYYSHFVAPC